jgi:S1-C subfamily serine protease
MSATGDGDPRRCARCGQRGLVQLAPGQPCAPCAGAIAWSQLEGQRLVIDRASIDAAVARRRGAPAPSRWRSLPLGAACSAAAGAAVVAAWMRDRAPLRLGPLAELLAEQERRGQRVVVAAAVALGLATAALVLGRRRPPARSSAARAVRLAAPLGALVIALAALVIAGVPQLLRAPTSHRHDTMPPLALGPLDDALGGRIARATVVILAPGEDGDARALTLGSGAVIARDAGRAWIVTCSHVAMPYAATGSVRDPRKAQPVWVQLADGRQGEGRVRWTAPPPLDVALVELAVADAPEPVPIAADATAMQAGEPVAFVPNPYRDGWLLHRGVILHRRAHTTPAGRYELLYTDLPVIPGDSGSGLYDSRGQLVGLNTWTRLGDDGAHGISLPAEVMRTLRQAIDELDVLAEVDEVHATTRP